MTPQAYLRSLQLKAYNSDFGIDINTINPNSERAKERILRAKGVLFPHEVDLSDEDITHLEDLAKRPTWMRFDPVAEIIYSDSLKLLNARNETKMKKAVVGFLPIGVVNACCIGGLSNGYVVAINYGLYYTFLLLSIALIAPDTKGEILQDALESVYPEKILKASIDYAIMPSQDNFRILERYHSYLTPELLGIGSPGVTKILQFVFLHEAGHICNGDVDKGQALAVFDFDNRKFEYINASYLREYAADSFALNAFLSQSKDAISAWGQFSQIQTFFLFLNYVEKTGKWDASKTHPPAVARLRRLRKIVQERWGKDELGYTKTIGVRLDTMKERKSHG